MTDSPEPENGLQTDVVLHDSFLQTCCHWQSVHDGTELANESVRLRDHFSATVELTLSEPQPQYGLVQLNATRQACGCLVSCDVDREEFLAAVAKVLDVTITPGKPPAQSREAEQTNDVVPSLATVMREQLAAAICYEKGHRRGTPAEARGEWCVHCWSRALVHVGVVSWAARGALAAEQAQGEAAARAEALAVASTLLQRIVDYWDGRPVRGHGEHIYADLIDVLRAVQADAMHNAPEGDDRG